MQKIRYNFKQSDGAIALNEHFIGLVSAGVKEGFNVYPVPGEMSIELGSGTYLDKDGFLIAETAPQIITGIEPLVDGPYRVDQLVIDYFYEEKTDPNVAEFKIIKGIEGQIPSIPDLTDTQFLLACIYVYPGDTAIDKMNILQSNRSSNYDIGHNNMDTQEYTLAKTSVGIDGTKTVTVYSGLAIVNGRRLPIVDPIYLDISPIYNNMVATNFVYTVNSGVAQVPSMVTDDRKINLPIKFDITTAGFLPEDITLLTVTYKDRYDTITVNTAESFTSDDLIKYSDTSFGLPISDVWDIVSIDIASSKNALITVTLLPIIPVFIVEAGGEATLAATLNIQGLHVFDKWNRDQFLLVGYMHGETFVSVKRNSNTMLYKGRPSVAGMVRVYHFLGHRGYSVNVINNEAVEHFSNYTILDTMGTASKFNSLDYASVYFTGGGDINKTTDVTLTIEE